MHDVWVVELWGGGVGSFPVCRRRVARVLIDVLFCVCATPRPAPPQLDHAIPEDIQTAARNVVPKVEKARLYRGRGGEYMRGAVCRLIEALGDSKLPLTRRLVLRLLDTLDDCLRHPHDTIQNAAAAGLRALVRSRLAEASPEVHTRLPLKHCKLLASPPNATVSRGSALALGALPRAMLAPAPEMLETVVATLIAATRLQPKADDRDAETRRNCVQSLATLVEVVGPCAGRGGDGEGDGGLTPQQVRRIYAALLLSVRDYATDKR